jgi:hypothetical protein
MITDARLQDLSIARAQLLKDLATVLRRVGYNHPTRKKTNAQRSKRRKMLRKALRINAENIASRVLELMEYTLPKEQDDIPSE